MPSRHIPVDFALSYSLLALVQKPFDDYCAYPAEFAALAFSDGRTKMLKRRNCKYMRYTGDVRMRKNKQKISYFRKLSKKRNLLLATLGAPAVNG